MKLTSLNNHLPVGMKCFINVSSRQTNRKDQQTSFSAIFHSTETRLLYTSNLITETRHEIGRSQPQTQRGTQQKSKLNLHCATKWTQVQSRGPGVGYTIGSSRQEHNCSSPRRRKQEGEPSPVQVTALKLPKTKCTGQLLTWFYSGCCTRENRGPHCGAAG